MSLTLCPNPYMDMTGHFFTEKWDTTPLIDISSITDHKVYIDLSKIIYMDVSWDVQGSTPKRWKVVLEGQKEFLFLALKTGQLVWEALKRYKSACA